MRKGMNLNEMSYNELVAMSAELQKTINLKREEAIKKAIRDCMETYGVTKEEMESLLEREDSIKEDSVVTPEVVAIPLTKAEEVPALPEPQEENNVETEVEIKPTSVFDLPVFKEGYNPLKTKESVTTNKPEKTSVKNTDEEIPSMESLLCDDPRYQDFYQPDSTKKNNRDLLSMDELLSGEPINRILNLGNLNPKGAPYLQHTRINHVDGIIPTETATGKTLVYLPS